MNADIEQVADVIAGDALVILKAIQNHTVIALTELKEIVQNLFDSEDVLNNSISGLISNGYVTHKNGQLELTDVGLLWIQRSENELQVELDLPNTDVGEFEGTPKKPYDVAKLKMENRSLSIFQVLRKIDKKEILLNPDFQRAFVWDLRRQSQLIESILIRIPLPAFYIDATNNLEWNVVDGLQRLTTLYNFCRKQSFVLSGLQFLTELNGMRFDSLPPQFKVLIEDETSLLFYTLMPGTPVEAKYTIFSRVNTGGLQLTAQEIRHALSQGKITELLGRMAANPLFRIATEGAVESLRMSDRELILRALAFMHLGTTKYRDFNSLDSFLLYAMSEFNHLTDDYLKVLESDFFGSLKKVRSIFGKYSFRKFNNETGRRSPLNKALFEVWVVSVRKYSEDSLINSKKKIVADFFNLIDPYNYNNASFLRSISASTGGQSAVNARFSEVENLLDRALNDK